MKEKIPSFWWSISSHALMQSLQVDPEVGLQVDVIKKNRLVFGPNDFFESKPRSIFAIALESLREPMMLLLLAIALLSFVFGKIGGAIAMILEVILYATLELVNKFRTDHILIQLKNNAHSSAMVLRNNLVQEINRKDVVVGDILILSAGVSVAADALLILSHGLSVDESSLTGESLPVEKNANAVSLRLAALAERKNAVFSGTVILNGEGKAIVTAVGEYSEFGKINKQVQACKEERTILQESMDRFAKILAIVAVVISIIIPFIGFFRGLDLQEMILTWLALTFLMIPCQPPIIITMALLRAAFKLAKKNVVAKRLFGIEGIGQVSAIVSDKTGTITESIMSFDTFLTARGDMSILPRGIAESIVLALPDYYSHVTDRTVKSVLGNYTKNKQQVGFSGFTDGKPWRDLVYKDTTGFLHVITGNPEMIIAQSTLLPDEKSVLVEAMQKKAKAGYKLFAYGSVYSETDFLDQLERITFLAVAVVKDPVRFGVKGAIETLAGAGIKTFIVTGDHKATAQAIALEVGITGEVVIGEQLDAMTDEELALQLKKSNIFARMEPLQKLRLVQMLKRQKEVVACLGDGANDAPALKAANVGIAMGFIGTDIAKEVSDLVLTDDNYIHIPDSIEIGRNALDNFKKGLAYYLSAKLILMILFVVPLFFAISFPFVSIHIILIEMLLDLASSTMFVMEEAEPGIMQRPPARTIDFLGMPLMYKVIRCGLALAVGILFLYFYAYRYYDLVTAQTVALVAWLLGHILLALNLKQDRMPLLKQPFSSNYVGIFWLSLMVMVSFLITSVPLLYPYSKTTFLPISLWVELVGIVVITTCWIEVAKFMKMKIPM